jgi:hypothetical protein
MEKSASYLDQDSEPNTACSLPLSKKAFNANPEYGLFQNKLALRGLSLFFLVFFKNVIIYRKSTSPSVIF